FVSGDGRRLLVGDGSLPDATTSVWDLTSRTELVSVPGGPGQFGADGETFTTSQDQLVSVWNSVTGERVATLSSVTHAGGLSARSADGKLIAVKDASSIRVLDVATDTEVIPPITVHTADPFVRFLPDGRLFTASADRVVIFRLETKVAPIGAVLSGTGTSR